ncbi:MAG: PadR family transcriptional regulator [Nitrososphaerales archaeon]|nr:PadR family transcriptional regulator [Nitrososphaerales archaeon]
MIGRGIFKYIVLQTLKDKPMHGYEIMKTISDRFSGCYAPSAGIVYPTLQMLEDLGYVTAKEESGKKVYFITDEGRKFLEEKEKVVKGIAKNHILPSERISLNKELRSFARLIMTNYWDLTPEEAGKVERIIKEARDKINSLLLEGQ